MSEKAKMSAGVKPKDKMSRAAVKPETHKLISEIKKIELSREKVQRYVETSCQQEMEALRNAERTLHEKLQREIKAVQHAQENFDKKLDEVNQEAKYRELANELKINTDSVGKTFDGMMDNFEKQLQTIEKQDISEEEKTTRRKALNEMAQRELSCVQRECPSLAKVTQLMFLQHGNNLLLLR